MCSIDAQVKSGLLGLVRESEEQESAVGDVQKDGWSDWESASECDLLMHVNEILVTDRECGLLGGTRQCGKK